MGRRTSALFVSGFQDLVAAQTQLEGGCSASIPRELSAGPQPAHNRTSPRCERPCEFVRFLGRIIMPERMRGEEVTGEG